MLAAINNPTGKKRRFHLYYGVMLIALLGLVWSGFSRYVLAPQQSSTVPQYLGTLKLVSHEEGPEALADINRLHGTEISLKDAFIADYAAPYGGKHMMVWVGEAGSRAAAEDLIDRMVKGISKGGSGFTNPRQVQVAGQEIWRADGPNGNFFFYISKEPADRVVWLTIEAEDSSSLLESALKVF